MAPEPNKGYDFDGIASDGSRVDGNGTVEFVGSMVASNSSRVEKA